LDEAHERSVDADLLSLVLKLHIQHKLADFKLIIMSATLQGRAGLGESYAVTGLSAKVKDGHSGGVIRGSAAASMDAATFE